ncbi:uncharacterized protein HKW66_Vig0238620 [Vigna angularis]|uniref:Uncharacterized protein n=1 Tax=Phaseolus angularis TaxID=3914 RepID=A0A8T0KY16_PHAAN|nr:uncharacterized protein HKW66_Vig0238620 [Vigna angularis]
MRVVDVVGLGVQKLEPSVMEELGEQSKGRDRRKKVFKADIGPPTEELLNASSRPVIRPYPCAQNNNKNKDVGPYEKACPSASNNKTTTPMED